MSEFMLNTYTAASLGVPALFLSGDEAVCRLAGCQVPGIETVVTKRGTGGATICEPQGVVLEQIRTGVKNALGREFAACRVNLPEEFSYEVTFKDWRKAYQMSFYPGMEKVDTFTNRLVTKRWMDVVTAHCFVVY